MSELPDIADVAGSGRRAIVLRAVLLAERRAAANVGVEGSGGGNWSKPRDGPARCSGGGLIRAAVAGPYQRDEQGHTYGYEEANHDVRETIAASDCAFKSGHSVRCVQFIIGHPVSSTLPFLRWQSSAFRATLSPEE